MHKKILSVGLAGLMTMAIAVPSVSAYNTKVNYDGHLLEQRLDIDNDGTEDITINDQVTFGIKVPATVNVDGPDGTAAIAGVIDTSVTLTAPESLEMKQDEVSANKLTALVNMGEDNTLTLDTSVQGIKRVTAGVNSKWNDNVPAMGNWSGNFEYNVEQAPQDVKEDPYPETTPEMLAGMTFTLNEDGQSYALTKGPSMNTVVVPKTYEGKPVTVINTGAFESTSVVNVTLPNTLIDIKDDAFYYCTSLSAIEIPEGVTHIGTGAFKSCRVMTSVKLPSTLKTIDNNVFFGCYSLTKLDIPEGVTTVGVSLCYEDMNLKEVSLPSTLTSLGKSAFNSCSAFDTLNYNGTIAQWNSMYRGTDWRRYSALKVIHCIDGNLDAVNY